jgi:uroporphyrinogen decarboxylase
MRQAGRYLPEYRKIREKHDIISICKDPELCSTVTSLPVEVLGVDAAIMFADIMLPLEGMGVQFEIKEAIGPVIKHPVRNSQSASALRDLDPKADVPFVLSAIQLTKKRLDSRVPLIGFCGAPFTLASYLIEGKPSRDFTNTKALMYRDPETWHLLLARLATAMTRYLRAQIQAGVDAVQLFDSWIGCLNSQDYEQYVLPHSQRIFKELESSAVPKIHFGTGTSNLLESMKQAGGDVFGVDWRIPIDVAWKRLGHDVAIQGNLDPAVLLADSALIKSRAADILRRVGSTPGHIFNLGHGMLPDTNPQSVIDLVQYVHSATQKHLEAQAK